MKQTFIILMMTLIGLQFTQAQHVNYDEYGKINIAAEDVRLEITGTRDIIIPAPKDNTSSPNKMVAPIAGILTSLIPMAIDLVKSGVKSYNEKEKLRYEGIYSAQTSGQGFYGEEYKTIQMPKLKLIRRVYTQEDETVTACEIELNPEISNDKMAFRYQLGKVQYIMSKAKVKSNYEYIMPNVSITFESYYLDNSEYKKTESTTASLKIPPLKIGLKEKDFTKESIYSSWITLPPQSTIKENDKSVPVDMSIYQVEVTVNELNLYKSKAEDIAKTVADNQDPTIVLLNEIIKQALQKKEE